MKEKNIQELAIRMGLITVEDMCQYTIAQLVVKIANKVNELVGEVWRFETDVQEMLKTQNENIQYLLGEGLHLEVENIFDVWVQDGTFDTLLNQSALKKVNDRIDETNTQLSNIGARFEIKGVDISLDLFNTRPNDKSYSNSDGIRKAIQYAVENNINSIFIPSGVWYIDVQKPIFIPNNFKVYGNGSSSVLKAMVETYDNISLSDFNDRGLNSILCCGDHINFNFSKSNDEKNITISSICVDGGVIEPIEKITSSSNYWDTGFGIILNYGGGFNVENVKIINTLGTGLMFDRNFNTLVNNVHVDNCGKYGARGSSRNGVSFVGINDTTKKGCILTNSLISNNGDVGVQYAYTPIIIKGNQIFGNETFGVEGDSSYSGSDSTEHNRGDVIVTDNYIVDTQVGITISNVNNQKIIISNNTLKRLTKTPIFVSQTLGGNVIVSGNVITNVKITTQNENCIYVKAKTIQITNNNISYFSNPNNSCLSIDVSNNVVINSNIIYSCLANKVINLRCANATITSNSIECCDKSNKGINLRGKELKKLIIKDNTIEDVMRECISSELEKIDCDAIDISGNIFNNSSSGECNVVNLISSELSTVKSLFFNNNYCDKNDTSQTVLRFLEVGNMVTVKNFIALGNYFNSTIGRVGGNLHLGVEPTYKVVANNQV